MDILEVELIDQWTVGYEDSWVINGCLVERYFVVPAEEWQFGDPLIHDSHVETCSTLLQVVDIEPDWQGAFWSELLTSSTLITILTAHRDTREPPLPRYTHHTPYRARGHLAYRQRGSTLRELDLAILWSLVVRLLHRPQHRQVN